MASKAKKVAILGFDCAEPHLLKQLIAEGHLPTFKKLFDGGVLAENCLSPYPTITPPNWASIATGAWPGTHQVTDFHLHQEGTSQINANTFEAFSSENCKSEYIWERLDAAGLKCIVFNYPGSWPNKMKNGIMVAGAGLGPDEYRNGRPGLEAGLSLGYDQLVATGFYPWGSKIEFQPAKGWKNLPAKTEDPLEASFPLAFREAMLQIEPTSWHILLTQSSGNGYDRMTLSPTKDFKNAFFTLSVGEWSKNARAKFKPVSGSEISANFRAKLLEMSDDGEDFRLLISRFCVEEGWTSPPELAKEIVSQEGTFTFGGGVLGYGVGWYELDTYAETIELHDHWLGDAATYLIKNKPWDLFCMHSHPIDWSYHVMLTDMDKNTCSSDKAYKDAWEAHLKVCQSQDRLLARIVEAAGDDTLFVLVSDHGAVADGATFNPYVPLMNNGLCVMEGADIEHPDMSGMESDSWRQAIEGLKSTSRMGKEVLEFLTMSLFKPDMSKSKAVPQRTVYIYVNLKGRDPGGIVDPADYEKVQQQIIDALYTYVDPATGKRPVSLALSKRDARILGLYGEAVGDVVYAIYPEYGGQHGPQLATTEWGVGKLRALLAFYGPGIKKGFTLERTSGLTDVVPTVCYMMDWPLPADAEGAVLYQAFKDPDFKSKEINKLRDGLARMETALQRGGRQPWDKHECA